MSKKVLVIDGDRPFASAISAALRARGLVALAHADGSQALERVRAERPDLVVLCAELPGSSGYSVCNKLRRDEQLRPIPLVMTSSQATPEIFQQHAGLRTRADEYLLKPFDAATLIQKMSRLIELPPEPDRPVGATPEGVGSSWPMDDEDTRLIEAAFDQLAFNAGGAMTPPVLVPSPARARPAGAPVPVLAPQAALDATHPAGERALAAERRAAAAEARVAELEQRLQQHEDARQELREALAAAIRLLDESPPQRS